MSFASADGPLQTTLKSLLEFRSIVVTLDRNGLILGFNAEAASFFGYSESEVRGQDYCERFLEAPNREAARRRINTLIAGHPVTTFESAVVTRHGPRMVSWDAAGLPEEGGEAAGLVAVGRDVTDRYNAEKKLAESEARLRWLTDVMPGAAFVMTTEGGAPSIPYMTEGVSAMMPVTADQIKADVRVLFGQVHPNDAQELRAGIREARDRRSHWHMDFRTVGGRWIRGHAVPHPTADGTLEWIGLFTDITVQKTMESHLQLASRLSAVGAMSAGLAHELNNPLSYVLANLSYATETLGSLPPQGDLPEVIQALQDALEGAGQMREIVADLKTLSRVDEQPVGPVNVGVAWLTAIRMTRHELAQRAQVRVGETVPANVQGNPARLVHALVSLLLYVRGRLPAEGHRQQVIHLRTGLMGSRLALEIEDDGPAVSPDQLSGQTEPWFELRSDLSGPGLLLCRNVIQEMGGTMEVTNGPSSTRFRILLPTLPD